MAHILNRRMRLALSIVPAYVALVLGQAVADAYGWRVPWYAVQEVVVGLVPLAWLAARALPVLGTAQRWSVGLTVAGFVSLASSLELVAVQKRIWFFSQEVDPLTGLMIGGIPLEEFLAYPILLTLPILLYLVLQGELPEAVRPLHPNERWTVWLGRTGLAVAAAGAAGWIALSFRSEPPLDLSAAAAFDAEGALRYAAGPAQRTWTGLEVTSTGVALWALAALWPDLHRRALLTTVALYFPYAFFVELMATGRGWWVWNASQVSGVFTWVLPIDSYLMYLTGALLPVLTYEALRTRAFR